jgi:ABC-type Zn uptake system ZnuABC Zn-binding protein ZnuA
MSKEFFKFDILVLILLIALTSCNTPVAAPVEQSGDRVEKMKVVATTSIVSDVVRQVGGDQIELTTLLPLGADPHGFEPAPQDIATVSQAQVVFANGAGLEEFLDNLIESAGAQEKVVYVSEGVELLDFAGIHSNEAEEEPGAVQAEDIDEQRHADMGKDPHTWTDPNNVIIWVQAIAQSLSELDPQNAQIYQANAERYRSELEQLDGWIAAETSQVPEAQRVLVTDHLVMGYFGERYGFEQVAALIPGYSSMAQPSAQELAALEEAIRTYQVPAIFVGNTVNPELAQRVAADTGTQLVLIYTGSLSEPGGEAGTYLEYMRYNTDAMVNALK